MKNKKLLLSILTVLVMMKFIIEPLMNWQNKTLSETNRLQKKLDKAVAHIINMPELEQQKLTFKDRLNTKKGKIEHYSEFDRYKIDKQRQIEQLFNKNNVESTSFSWQASVDTEMGKATKLQIKCGGLLKNFIALKLDLMMLSSSIELDVFSIQTRNQTADSLGTISGNMLLVFNAVESTDAKL